MICTLIQHSFFPVFSIVGKIMLSPESRVMLILGMRMWLTFSEELTQGEWRFYPWRMHMLTENAHADRECTCWQRMHMFYAGWSHTDHKTSTLRNLPLSTFEETFKKSCWFHGSSFKGFSIVFLYSDWLKSNHLRSRIISEVESSQKSNRAWFFWTFVRAIFVAL